MTVATATDDILSMFKSAWEVSGAASEISTGVYVPVYWPYVDRDSPTDITKEWLRIRFSNVGSGGHSGIGSGTGRYTKLGSIMFQVFTEKGKGVQRRDLLVQQIVDAYDGEKSSSGVLFTNTRITDAGINEGWNMTNVIVEYEFDEFK